RIIQLVLAVLLGVVIIAVYRAHLWAIAEFAATHLLFPAVLVVAFGIVYGLIGAGYGLPSLFWHDRLPTRMGAATATTRLLALAGVRAFYAAGPRGGEAVGPDPGAVEDLLATVAPSLFHGTARGEAEQLARFLVVAGAPFLLLLLAPALLPGAFPRVPKSV